MSDRELIKERLKNLGQRVDELINGYRYLLEQKDKTIAEKNAEIERLRDELRHARRLLGALIVQNGGEIETTAQETTTGA